MARESSHKRPVQSSISLAHLLLGQPLHSVSSPGTLSIHNVYFYYFVIIPIITSLSCRYRDRERRLDLRCRGDADRDLERRRTIPSFIFFAFCFALKNSNRPSFSQPSLQQTASSSYIPSFKVHPMWTSLEMWYKPTK